MTELGAQKAILEKRIQGYSQYWATRHPDKDLMFVKTKVMGSTIVGAGLGLLPNRI